MVDWLIEVLIDLIGDIRLQLLLKFYSRLGEEVVNLMNARGWLILSLYRFVGCLLVVYQRAGQLIGCLYVGWLAISLFVNYLFIEFKWVLQRS